MYKFITLLSLIILVGCSSRDNSATTSAENKFVSNEVTQHEIGSRNNSLGRVQFSLLSKHSTQSTVVVNFQKLPYHITFDLCEDTGRYDFLSNVLTNKDGDSRPMYESKKVGCNSEVVVRGDQLGNYLVSYDLNFLVGYRVTSFKGYDVLFPQTQKRRADSRFVQLKDVESIDSKILIMLDI